MRDFVFNLKSNRFCEHRKNILNELGTVEHPRLLEMSNEAFDRFDGLELNNLKCNFILKKLCVKAKIHLWSEQ